MTLENRVPSGEMGTFPTYSFLLSSIEERKQRRQQEILAPCMGKMPSERARQENGFLVLRRIFLTLVTLHIQEDLRGLMKIF